MRFFVYFGLDEEAQYIALHHKMLYCILKTHFQTNNINKYML